MPTVRETSIRLRIITERYEIAGSLYSLIAATTPAPRTLTASEQIALGILAGVSENGDGTCFVKPADPDALRALLDGGESDALERLTVTHRGKRMETPIKGTGNVREILLCYQESEASGMQGSTTAMTYRSDRPAEITMRRSGSVKTTMSFCTGTLATATYQTAYMPFDIALYTLAIDNRLGSDGVLILDYIMEARGGSATRCRMRVEVQ